MARTRREKSAMGVYHVLFRAEDKLFFSGADYEQFKLLLQGYFSEGTQKLLAYSLSESKIHLILYEGDEETARILKPLGTSYARYINRTYSRSGKLFYDRYKSEAIQSGEQLLSCIIYVHNTPGDTSVSEYESDSALCDTAFAFETIGGRGVYDEEARTGLRVMCMDDYEHMDDAQVGRYIRMLSGKSVAQIKAMEKKRRTEILRTLTEQKWVSARRLGMLLDAGRTMQPKKQEKAPVMQKTPVADTGLSVWLL